MGTRGLTVVYKDGTHKIAQYGQWDHYPEGQGLTALQFLRDTTADVGAWQGFLDALDRVSFHPGPDALIADFPLMDRDHGAEILEMVAASADPVVLRDSLRFALDGLFCEWVWVVDLDAGTFGTCAFEKGHGGAIIMGPGLTWPLADLPSDAVFLAAFKEEE